jgi:hypothetical protein
MVNLIPRDQRFDWRAHLKVHPAADMCPLMSEEDLAALAADIQAHQMQKSIVLAEILDKKYRRTAPPLLLDGRNRLDALAALGCLEATNNWKTESPVAIVQGKDGEFPFVVDNPWELVPCESYDAPHLYDHAISLNLHRRHLTGEQKREVIGKLLKAKPEQSDRAIAEQVKADHKTVGAVRKEKEATGEIPQLEKKVGADGKARKASKTPKPPEKKTVAPKALKVDYEAPKTPAVRQFCDQMNDQLQKLPIVEVEPSSCDGGHCVIIDNGERFARLSQAPNILAKNIFEACGPQKAADIVTELQKLLAQTGNGVDPETSAEPMKAKFALPADGSIPDFMRR